MPKIVNEHVLVLNKYFLAIQVTLARDAICALVTGKARVVDQNYTTYDWQAWQAKSKELFSTPEEAKKYAGRMSSPSTSVYVPQVILIPDCEHTKSLLKAVRFSRKNVLQRDGYRCAYCKHKFDKNLLTMDHVIPRAKGGTNAWSNVVACCRPCNEKKGDKLLSQLGWELTKKPATPQWKAHINKRFNDVKKTYWKTFFRQEAQ